MRAIAACLALLTIGTVHATVDVPVENPSFEASTAQANTPPAADWVADGSPAGWHHWIGTVAHTGTPVLTWERTGGHTGPRCVSLQGCVGAVCVIQSVPVTARTNYQVTVWARASSPDTACTLLVRWQTADGKWVAGETSAALPATAAHDTWQPIAVTARAPQDAGRLVILLSANEQGPNGKCWFDDVAVSRFEPGDIVVSACTWMHANLYPEGEPPATEHIKWARPWAGGKLRALFLLGSDHSLREQVEVAQRLDIDYDYTFANDFEEAMFAFNNGEIMRRLEQGAYDVIVVALRATADLSQSLLQKLGPHKGLVLIAGPNVSPALPPALKLGAAPADHYLRGSLGALPPLDEKGSSGVRAIDLAEGPFGRIVRITYSQPFRCLTPTFDYERFLAWGASYWEGYLQTVIRAMVWAAGKEPASRLALTPTAQGAQATLRIPAGAPVVARTWVTDRLNRKCGERRLAAAELPLSPTAAGTESEGRLTIPCPPQAASGPAMYNVIVETPAGQVLGFASCLSAPQREARIVAVKPGKAYFAAGEPIALGVETAGPVAGMRVAAILTDIYGRQIAAATGEATAGVTSLALTLRDHLSTLNWAEVRLLQGDEERDAARCYVLSPASRQAYLEDFRIGTWAATGYHPAYLQDAMLAAMRRAEITEGLDSASAYLPTLAGGVWPVSTAYGAMPGFHPFAGPGTARKECLSDPEIRSKIAATAERVAKAEAGYSPILGYISDETSLVADALDLDTCSSPHCQRRYRDWLQGRYPSLDALNTDWRTQYKSWEEVGWTDYRAARKAGNLAPWVMYRRFMDTVWAEGVSWSSQNARRADPTAMLALPNSFGLNPFCGRDYWLLSAANDYDMEYPYDSFGSSPTAFHFDAVRSFAPDKVHHPWIGYVFSDAAIHFDPWWSALHGAAGLEIYGCMSVFAGHNSWAQVFPTLQLTRRGRMYAEIARPLKEGVGKALMTATRPQADIALLWSQPSLYVAWGLSDREKPGEATSGKQTYRQYFMSREAFRRSVIASGRQFDYVCEEQVKSGALTRYRCLVLPASFALGPEVCARITEFVERGGRVIADQGVGLANEAGAAYASGGPACELFGIQRTDRKLAYQEAAVSYPAPGGAPVTLQAEGHEQLASHAGVPAYADGSPVYVKTSRGRGEALLLNFAAADAAALAPLFRDLPVLGTITTAGGTSAPAEYEVVRLDRGAIQYLGVLHDYRGKAQDGPAVLQLPAAKHVFDVLSGKPLGRLERVPLALPRGHTALFACLDYEVPGLTVRGADRATAGQTYRAELTVNATATPGDHVLRVDAIKPGGERAEAYCRNVLTRAGQAALEIPFAPNDAPGKWQLAVRDIATGQRATQTIDLAR